MPDKTPNPDSNPVETPSVPPQALPTREVIAVDIQLLQAIGNYLGHQPYNQVADMIRAIEACPRVAVVETPR